MYFTKIINMENRKIQHNIYSNWLRVFSLYAYGLLCVSVKVKKGIEENLLYRMPMHNEKIIFYKEILVKDASIYVKITEQHLLLCKKIRVGNSHSLFLFLLLIVLVIMDIANQSYL